LISISIHLLPSTLVLRAVSLAKIDLTWVQVSDVAMANGQSINDMKNETFLLSITRQFSIDDSFPSSSTKLVLLP